MTNPWITDGPNASEAHLWATSLGQKWVDHQQALDRLFAEVTNVLLSAAAPQAGQHVLDLGCGAGATTLALAPRVGPEGAATGLDISPPLLRLARQRAAAAGHKNLDFLEADAQVHPFRQPAFDLLVSRFGSMFFSDPVAAFANLRTALRPGSRVHLAAWAPLADNPWFAIPRGAAIARLGPGPKAPPNEPGPFAFADRNYAVGLLKDAGLADVETTAVPVTLVPPDTLDEAAGLSVQVGPAARLIATLIATKNGTAADAAAIAQAVAAALASYQTADGVRVPAVINLFSARCP